MKSFTPAQIIYYSGQVTTNAMCVLMTATNGRQMGATTHTRDLTIDGVLYRSLQSAEASNLRTTADMAVNNLNLSGPIDELGLDAEDLLAGVWNEAGIEVFEVNYKDLSMGKNVKAYGVLGQVKIDDRRWYSIELRSLSQYLNQPQGRQVQPTCPFVFGDSDCGVDIAIYTEACTIDAVLNSRQFTVTSIAAADDTYNMGIVRFTSGACLGLSMEVRLQTGTTIDLLFPLLKRPSPGDTLTISRACDKSTTACQGYANFERFGGMPFTPGNSQLLRTPTPQ